MICLKEQHGRRRAGRRGVDGCPGAAGVVGVDPSVSARCYLDLVPIRHASRSGLQKLHEGRLHYVLSCQPIISLNLSIALVLPIGISFFRSFFV